jgi:hypothetical protein
VSWVVIVTGPGETDNHVEFSRFAGGARLASVDGVTEWDGKESARRAMEEYRRRVVFEAARAAGQMEMGLEIAE